MAEATSSFSIPENIISGAGTNKINKLVKHFGTEAHNSYTIADKNLVRTLIARHPIVRVEASKLNGFFLPVIIGKAKLLGKHQILLIEQNFEPKPLYSVLGKMGFKYYAEKKKDCSFHVYFIHEKILNK